MRYKQNICKQGTFHIFIHTCTCWNEENLSDIPITSITYAATVSHDNALQRNSKRKKGHFQKLLSNYLTAMTVVDLSALERTSTRPTKSPRPYSSTRLFLSSLCCATDLKRPFSTMKSDSDFSLCL